MVASLRRLALAGAGGAPAPAPLDSRGSQGARVFLEAKLATELDDAMLDAEMVGRGTGFKIVADA